MDVSPKVIPVVTLPASGGTGDHKMLHHALGRRQLLPVPCHGE
jgi:hypothetical protein